MPSQNMIETTLIEQAGPQIAEGEMDFVDLESVELELALDPETLRERGFEACLKEAAETGGFDYLFQLPAYDPHPGNQIAVVATPDRERLLYAVLDDSDGEIEIVPEEAMRSEFRDFAGAFVDVFNQLGEALSEAA